MSNIISRFFDDVGDALQDVGDTLVNSAKAILKDPIGLITTSVAISFGIPPVWAAALGSGTDAALHGGNVIKAAVTGGAMAAIGQYAGQAAASGGYGALAQSAVTGAASAVTGAVLTGQDLVTAVKTGLILGTAAGGIQQLMTKQEAISSVPKDVLTKAAAANDPVGALAKEMGWYDSSSAYDAAQTAWTQNRSSSITGLADTIPESVLKEAYDLPYYADQEAFIADKMGWDVNGNTMNAAGTAFDNYKTGMDSYNTSTAGQINQIASAADISHAEAGVLVDSGYTVNDVKNLVNLGYSGSDLADMASTGVPATTLKNLAYTQIPEHAIADLLENGVSANDISTASGNINRNLISVDNASQLLKAGFTGSDLNVPNIYQHPSTALNAVASGLDTSSVSNILRTSNPTQLATIESAINTGQLDASAVNNFVKQGGYSNYIFQNPDINNILELSQQGVSTKSINTMISNGVDISKVNDVLQTGTATAADINSHLATNNYGQWLNNEIAAGQHAIISDYLESTGVEAGDAKTLANNGFTAGDVEKLTKLGYTTSDLADMAATGVKPDTLTTLANTQFAEHNINNMLGSGQVTADEIASASKLVDTGKISTASAETMLTKGMTINQVYTVANAGKADSMASLIDKGVSTNSAMTMYNNGVDLKTANDLIDKGYLHADNLNTSPTNANNYIKTAQADLSAHDAQVKAQQLADEQAAAKVQAEAQAKALAEQQHADLLKNQQAAIDNMNNTMAANGQQLGGITKVETMVDANGNQSTFVTYGNGATNRFETIAPPGTQAHDWTTTVDNTQVAQAPAKPEGNVTQQPVQPAPVQEQPVQVAQQQPVQPEPQPQQQEQVVQQEQPIQPAPVQEQPVQQAQTNAVEPTPQQEQQIAQQQQPAHTGDIINSYTTPMADGSTQVVNYYSDGSVEVLHNEAPAKIDVSNMTQEELNQALNQNNPYSETGEGTQTAKLSDQSQKIVTDAQNDYLGGKTTFEDAANRVNKAVQDDIDSGYLKDNGDGTYTAPDGVIYFMNTETGMYDTRTGEVGGTGAGGTTEVKPDQNVIPPGPSVETNQAPGPVNPNEQPAGATDVTQTPSTTETTNTTPSINDIAAGGGAVTGGTSPTDQNAVGGSGTAQGTGTSTNGTTGGLDVGTTTGGIGSTTGPTGPVNPNVTEIPEITVTAPKEPPLTPPVQEVIPEQPKIPEVTVEEPTTEEPPVEEPVDPGTGVPYVPIPTTDTTPTEDNYRGHYTLGKPIMPAVPHTLNPGWITNVPAYYKTTNPAQSKFYWGSHPYQTGTTFDPNLYNQLPKAPVVPFGATKAQTAATPAQILAAMRGQYPLLNTVSVNGPVAP